MKVALTISDIDGVSLPALIAALGLAGMPISINTNGGNSDSDEDNTPVNTAAPLVDSTGLPHDERIHSKAKTQTESGAWRKRKGVADSLVATVEAELRSRQPAQQPAPIQQQQPQVTGPVPMPVQQPAPMQMPQTGAYPTGPGNVVAQPGPLAGSMPYQPQPMPAQQPVQQPPQQQAGPMDFNGFMLALTNKMRQVDANGAPLVNATYFTKIVGEISQAFQTPLTVITDIAGNPRVAEMVNYAIQLMQRDQKW